MSGLARRLLAPAFIALGIAASTGGRAHAGWILNPVNGHYYNLTATAEVFHAAEAEAVTLGGHLAAIADQSEQDFITNNFLTAPQASAVPYWIGFTDEAAEGTFVWTSGEAVTYTNWNSGEPNDFLGEDYAAINWHYAQGVAVPPGTWNDTPLNGTIGFGGNTAGPYQGIIELTFNPEAVPEPSTLLGCGLIAVALAGYRLRRRVKAA